MTLLQLGQMALGLFIALAGLAVIFSSDLQKPFGLVCGMLLGFVAMFVLAVALR